EKALDIYKELLQHTFEIASAVDASKYVFYFDKIEDEDIWNADGFFKVLQKDGDLGNKMAAAFTHLFNERCESVVIIGSDCFELTTNIIENAFSDLEINDIVIGPANDGGYYLLGMKKIFPFIFKNKKWSTESVFNETVLELEKNNISYKTLAVLTDVDTEEDWLATKKYSG
nr:TIGR04282 family arsenosugar biosynthesis glycosyltransferase [Bacteroidota bacterium]